MNNQANNADVAQYKIVFSNITCRIKLTQQGAYYIVIRLGTFGQVTIGKKSSKYSEKKPLSSGTLTFDNQLQVPFDGHVLSNQCIRRDKCEIMLYRSKSSGERQSKQLIGMASLGLGNQMFEGDVKRLKLTNSEDKEAYIECKVKIQLGDADILSVVNNESKLSSFFTKLDENSFVSEIQQMPPKTLQNQNEFNFGLIKPNNQKLLGIASQSIKEDNQILELLKKDNSENTNLSSNGNQIEWKSEGKIEKVNATQLTSSSEEVIWANQGFQDERRSLKKICDDLQKQNQILVNKVQKLQHQLSNQNITSTKSTNDRPPIPRPAGSIMRSPMIKKNNTIMVTQPSKNQIGELIEFQKSSQMIPHKEGQHLNNQKFISNANNLAIKNVIGILYKPPVNSRTPRHDISSYNDRQNSLTNKSVSNEERSKEHSYSKFNGKKKYQIIGTIKSPDQSQNGSYIEHSSLCQSDQNRIIPKFPLKQINQRNGSLNGSEKQSTKGNCQNQTVFLDFLDENQKQENPLEGVFQPSEIKQNIIHSSRAELYKKSRITLEQLDIKTEEKFRKNERALKIANTKILEENIQLKQEKKILLKQIDQKRELSHEQVFDLKNEIKSLSYELQSTKNSKLQNEQKLTELSKHCATLQQENAKLKKQLKEQKIKYEYYFKISNINDHKEKEKGGNKKGTHVSIQDKRTSGKLDPDVFTSNIEPTGPHITSIRDIHSSDVELNKKRNISETKSLKKVNFTSRDKSIEDTKLGTSYFYHHQQQQKPNIPKPASSYAVLKLKEQTILENKNCSNQNLTFTNLRSKSFAESKEQSLPSNFLGGFIGTGSTANRK